MTVYRTHRDALIGTRMAGDRFAARHRIIKATREGRHVGWMAQVKSDSQQGGRMMTRDHEHEYPGRQAIGGPVCGPDPDVDPEAAEVYEAISVLRDRLAEQIKRLELARRAEQAATVDQYGVLAWRTFGELRDLTGEEYAGAAARIIAAYGLPPGEPPAVGLD